MPIIVYRPGMNEPIVELTHEEDQVIALFRDMRNYCRNVPEEPGQDRATILGDFLRWYRLQRHVEIEFSFAAETLATDSLIDKKPES